MIFICFYRVSSGFFLKMFFLGVFFKPWPYF